MCGGRRARQADFALGGLIRRLPVAQDHVGEDERARDRALAREHAACAHRRVFVERGLDLFRVHLGAADVDDPAAPADKIEPVPASLDHVAGVDETVLAGQTGRVRAKKSQSAAV